MSETTEAFSRVKTGALLKDAAGTLTDGVSILFEHDSRCKCSWSIPFDEIRPP